jgi:hypothetical protein
VVVQGQVSSAEEDEGGGLGLDEFWCVCRARCAAIFLGRGKDLDENQLKVEAHVFAVPHDVVGAPGIVEEVEVDAFVEARLLAREIQWRLNSERYQWRVGREDG